MQRSLRSAIFLLSQSLAVLLTLVSGAVADPQDSTVAQSAAVPTSLPVSESEPSDDRPFFTDAHGEAINRVLERLFFSASARFRPEVLSDDLDFNGSDDDDREFFSNRYRLGIGADLSHDVSLYFDLQNNSTWGDDATLGANLDTVDDDDIKVYLAYAEARDLFGKPVTVRIGRQELIYGSEMLLGDADFGPGLSHDAIKVSLDFDSIVVDAWWAKEVEAETADPTDEDADFWGVYGMWKAAPNTGVDAYWLFLRDAQNGVDDKRHTVGARACLLGSG